MYINDNPGWVIRKYTPPNKSMLECKKACMTNKNCAVFGWDATAYECILSKPQFTFNHNDPKMLRRVVTKSCLQGSYTHGKGGLQLLSGSFGASQSSVGWNGFPGRAVDGKTEPDYGRK